MGYFSSVSSFLHMGGYADYVWSAYAVVVVIMLASLLKAGINLVRIKTKLRRRYANHT